MSSSQTLTSGLPSTSASASTISPPGSDGMTTNGEQIILNKTMVVSPNSGENAGRASNVTVTEKPLEQLAPIRDKDHTAGRNNSEGMLHENNQHPTELDSSSRKRRYFEYSDSDAGNDSKEIEAVADNVIKYFEGRQRRLVASFNKWATNRVDRFLNELHEDFEKEEEIFDEDSEDLQGGLRKALEAIGSNGPHVNLSEIKPDWVMDSNRLLDMSDLVEKFKYYDRLQES